MCIHTYAHSMYVCMFILGYICSVVLADIQQTWHGLTVQYKVDIISTVLRVLYAYKRQNLICVLAVHVSCMWLYL